MDDNELDKTFVERPLSTLIPPAYAHGGSDAPFSQSNARPIIGQTRFGSSVVTEIIGEGGMATVYKVWNERLEVFRAVKLLSQEAFSARFETEAKITAKLHHAGIVEIHNIGEWNGLPYMEMEFVDGSDLQKTLTERGKLPEIVCIAIAVRIAEALAHAHTKEFTLVGKQYCGIIHRDLKPANIMISKHGEVKLTDFGIARPAQTSLYTMVGNIAGTMHYLSPEQMNGGEVDNRSDIYSFGAILYEMVTGAKTFPQESVIELIKQKSDNKFKPLRDYGIPINADFEKIILRCLKFVPTKRYQRTQELVGALQELKESLTKRTPLEVLENYLNGVEEVVCTEAPKTAVKPVKPTKPVKPVKSKPEKAPVSPKPPKLSWKQRTAKISAILAKALPIILFVPRWIWGRIKTIKISVKPKPVKTPVSPKPPKSKLPKKPKPARKITISKRSMRMFLAPLLLITVILLSYITIRAFTAKTLTTTKTTKTKISADTTTLVQKATPETLTTSVSENTKPDSTTATNTKSITGDSAVSAPKKVLVSKTQPLDVAVTEPDPPDPMSEGEQLHAAIAANNAKKWDRVIEILEQDGVFKEKSNQRSLYLLNAYVESRRLDKAQAIMDVLSATLPQDSYFNLCAGKFWYYRGSYDRALKYFESSLHNSSVIDTDDVLPGTALYFIADIKQERFKVTPSASNRSSALEAWREVRDVYILKPNDSRAKRAEREISALDAGN